MSTDHDRPLHAYRGFCMPLPPAPPQAGGRLVADRSAHPPAVKPRISEADLAELIDLDLQLTAAIHAGQTRWAERWALRREIRSRL